MTVKSTATMESSALTASSVAETTRAVVQEFLAARLAGDTERLVALFADEVDWLLAENPAAPWIRPRSTAAECAAQFTELMEHTVPEDARASVDTFLVDDTDAVLMGARVGDRPRDGKVLRGPVRAAPHRREQPDHPAPPLREQPVDRRGLRPMRAAVARRSALLHE